MGRGGGGESRSFQYIWGHLYQKHDSIAWVSNQILQKTMESNNIAMSLPPHIARWTSDRYVAVVSGFFMTDNVVTIKTLYLWELKNPYGPCFCSHKQKVKWLTMSHIFQQCALKLTAKNYCKIYFCIRFLPHWVYWSGVSKPGLLFAPPEFVRRKKYAEYMLENGFMIIQTVFHQHLKENSRLQFL